MKRNQGFTLIELIIVIVILGILAVTAAPRFLNFSGDARTSTLNGVKGALESAGALVYGKAIIAGQQNGNGCLTADGDVIVQPNGGCTAPATGVVNGYPAPTVNSIRAVAELVAAEWNVAVGTGDDAPAFGATANSVVVSPVGTVLSTDAADSCHVVYEQAVGGGVKPVITVHANGC
ncbi:MSHA pilin protein MshA [Rheinheimera pacifica]|uniref:prepilin-type N-terminal cleavage/methylation domain-containing protein n=1 Tax=Rheinheimera pacifica TaxID=173990 RepID=UPI00286E9753|nr:prepilin-type N-terminal cleavage/methylation domain-containing protein [Rheinheimera pacifica]MCS4308887.1 MSHA pilin protein MshA [Rheinheimera pacifica]